MDGIILYFDGEEGNVRLRRNQVRQSMIPPADGVMIRLQLMSKRFGTLTVLDRIDLEVKTGEVLAGGFFDNMRPVKLEAPEEIHGIYIDATEYLNDKRGNATGAWAGQPMREIVRIVNDLVEKSIRNYDISKRWSSGNP